MKKIYNVTLVNHQGCAFDNATFTNLAKAKKWAAGRGRDYKTFITINDDREPTYEYVNKNS